MKVLFAIWAKEGKSRRVLRLYIGIFAQNLDEKNNPKYLVYTK